MFLRGLVVSLGLLCFAHTPVHGQTQPPAGPQEVALAVPVPGLSGNGTCSQGNVVSVSYNVTANQPGLQAVLLCSKASYDALLPANLSDPNTASLPPPLLDLSCYNKTNLTSCNQTFPANKQLKAQEMCILLKNGYNQVIHADIQVLWTYGANTNPPSSVNGTATSVKAGAWGFTMGAAVVAWIQW